MIIRPARLAATLNEQRGDDLRKELHAYLDGAVSKHADLLARRTEKHLPNDDELLGRFSWMLVPLEDFAFSVQRRGDLIEIVVPLPKWNKSTHRFAVEIRDWIIALMASHGVTAYPVKKAGYRSRINKRGHAIRGSERTIRKSVWQRQDKTRPVSYHGGFYTHHDIRVGITLNPKYQQYGFAAVVDK